MKKQAGGQPSVEVLEVSCGCTAEAEVARAACSAVCVKGLAFIRGLVTLCQ